MKGSSASERKAIEKMFRFLRFDAELLPLRCGLRCPSTLVSRTVDTPLSVSVVRKPRPARRWKFCRWSLRQGLTRTHTSHLGSTSLHFFTSSERRPYRRRCDFSFAVGRISFTPPLRKVVFGESDGGRRTSVECGLDSIFLQIVRSTLSTQWRLRSRCGCSRRLEWSLEERFARGEDARLARGAHLREASTSAARDAGAGVGRVVECIAELPLVGCGCG